MRRAIESISAAGPSNPIPVSFMEMFQVGFGVVITGTATFKVQHTFDDIFDPTVIPTWFDHPVVTGQTANKDGNYAYPIAALRLNVTTYGSGTATLTALSASR